MRKLTFKKEKENKEKLPKRTWISRFDLLNKYKHWFLGMKSLFRSVFRAHAALQLVLVLTAVLCTAYAVAAIYTGSGEFVINVDKPMIEDGFYLSETNNFDEKLITLSAKAVENATNISIYDLPKELEAPDGEHHGKNYFAYTFYLKNETGYTKDYRYTVFVRNSTKQIETASWIMLYHNGKQQIYAMENKEGHPECQFSEFEFPFTGQALKPEKQQIQLSSKQQGYLTQDMIASHEFGSADGIFELQTVPFASDKTICSELREGIEADEVDKYTVIIWLEGEDPECVDEIIGGELELGMRFSYN